MEQWTGTPSIGPAHEQGRRPDTKQAEKEYLRRAASGHWELSKPFSGPDGIVNAEESADLIHDFAVMLRMLAPRPGDLILDLGSGGCWVSDWLSRMSLCPVSMDISLDMLQVGRARMEPGRSGGLVVGDMEALPFASGSFDHACCLSAIHHVPSIPAALREICRVVRSDGRVAFLEPGANHSSLPASQAAMRDFGVLEQDIIVEQFMQQCRDAGFAYVQVLPLSYAVPGLGLSREEWQTWRRSVGRKRPLRAIEKMGRAALEFFGLGKRGPLMEESFSIHLSRTVGEWIEAHPVILAHRKMPSSLPEPLRHQGSVEVLSEPGVVREAEPVRMRVRVRNDGNGRWRASMRRPMATRVGIQLLNADGSLLKQDFERASLPHDVTPGNDCEVTIEFPAPPPGSYRLKIDMVAEGVTWFEEKGSAAVTVALRVTAQ